MLGSGKLKFLKSLHRKKERWEEKVFLVEGLKTVQEFINSNSNPIEVYVERDRFFETDLIWLDPAKIIFCSKKEMEAISQFSTPSGLVGLFSFFNFSPDFSLINQFPILYLDDIKDPGNLGTIIRSCDWFGIPQIFCSPETVELYNPKVIQSSMGSCARVQCFNLSFDTLVKEVKRFNPNINLIGTVLDGAPLNELKKLIKNPSNAIYVIGNESHGISDRVLNQLDSKLTIPKGKNSVTESLNASLAATLLLYEVFRK